MSPIFYDQFSWPGTATKTPAKESQNKNGDHVWASKKTVREIETSSNFKYVSFAVSFNLFSKLTSEEDEQRRADIKKQKIEEHREKHTEIQLDHQQDQGKRDS